MTISSLRRIFATVCFAVVALGFATACSSDNKDDAKPTAKSVLTLTVTPAAPNSAPTRVTLTCEPTGGDHKNAEAACAALTAVGGDFDKLAGDPGAVCAQVYEPVTGEATGTWQGKPVDWRKTFGNLCELSGRTTPVF
ncbi:SSI family serine proteinase inhibitor [Nocardia sp. NPDC049149]|uniref:SSI family serine proteinase inhibitor n=1 Tax=Nocardia sp. NPDC049149 TaxID=3364315 RepID=UPI0037223446